MMRGAALGLMMLLAGCAGGRDPVFATNGSAAGIKVDAPTWQPGSDWHYSDGYGLKDDPSQWIVRRGFLREDAQSSTVLRKLLFAGLPPGEGTVLSGDSPVTYRREYMAGDVQRNHVTSWTVEGRETIKVRNTEDGWTGFERWWFSPRAQNYVRMEYRYGNNPMGSRVLTEYHVGPAVLAAN